jgi:hypothetical protein
VVIHGNERTDLLANDGLISGILFLTTVNTSDIHTRARTRLLLTEWQKGWNDSEMGRYCYLIVLRVLVEKACTVNERVFLVAMTRLASSHTSKTIDFILSNNFQFPNSLDG